MDMCANNNRQASNTYHYSPENAEINIDSIAVAVAKLNHKILQLRKEIVAFKNENESHLIAAQNLSRSTPSGFNDLTKNEERRTDARYELQRNFKGDDSPGGTDLSARLSFAKRVREVKAASEAAVFKEDYPRDDKSIEDDERPNRSRVFELSGTYQKSISDVEKFEKEIDKRSGGDVRKPEDVKTSCFVDEKLRKSNKHQNKVVSDIHRNSSPRNTNTAKIKKKRISRGVQYDGPTVRQTRLCVRQFFLNCFRLKSNVKKYDFVQKIEEEESSDDKKKFDVGLQNEMNKSLGTIKFNHKSHDIEMENLMNNTDIKKEDFENDEDKVTNTSDNEKQKEDDNLKNCKVKINFLEKLSKVLNRNNNLKAQQDELQDDFNIVDSQSNKEEIDKPYVENKRVNDDRKREESRSRWDVKIFDRKKAFNNACKTATMNSDKESDVNKVKKRLDLCIVELNDIINDACVIFGSGKNSAITSE